MLSPSAAPPLEPTPLELAIQRDLAGACAPLLDRGTARASAGGGPVGPVGLALSLGEAVLRLVPEALSEAADLADPSTERIATSRIPLRSRAPVRASAYERAGDVIAPTRWDVAIPAARASEQTLRWLLQVTERALGAAREQSGKVSQAVPEAIAFRRARSQYGFGDVERLRSLEASLAGVLHRLTDLKTRLKQSAATGITPSSRLPRPFPLTPAWRSLRELYATFNDRSLLANWVAQSLLRPAERDAARHLAGAELPYLYQRWCGWRLDQALGALGFKPDTDPLPAILLAGTVEYTREETTLTLLCEPRFASRKGSIAGMTVAVGESTPDFVLLSSGSEGPEAHVLDPTLAKNTEARATKKRYLRTIRMTEARVVAGVRVLPGPERAWAASPLPGTKNLLEYGDWRGVHGTVPMNPLDYRAEPLLDWLRAIKAVGKAAR